MPLSASTIEAVTCKTAIAACFFFALPSTAFATAWAGAQAFWEVAPIYYIDESDNYISGLAPGFTISCSGFASPTTHGGGCGDYESLYLTNSSAVDLTKSLHREGYISLTNNTNTPFLGSIVFHTNFSAVFFGWGAGVDIPGKEHASYSSYVSGDGTGDSHGCDTDQTSGNEYMSPFMCGVQSPDSSEEEFAVSGVDAFETITLTYAIDITAEAKGIPEVPTDALMLGGLFAASTVMASRRRRIHPAG